jgi:chloramphenicol O-acetyltransferase
LFKTYKDPFFGVTFALDLTRFLLFSKQEGRPFFLHFLHVVLQAVNETEALKLRIREEEVVLHDVVHASYTLMTEEHVFRFVTVLYHQDLDTFLRQAQAGAVAAKTEVDVSDKDGVDDLVYVSSVPWLSYTAIRHAMPGNKNDSFPRLTWGKYTTKDDVTTMPFSVDAHHALMDGYDVALFAKRLQDLLDR